MSTAAEPGARRPLLPRILLVNLLPTLLLYAALVAIGLFTLTRAAERSARADIAAELRVLARRAEDLRVIAFADEIDYRIEIAPGDAPTQSLYLLLHYDGSKVVGNLTYWPEGLPAAEGPLRFDGERAGVAAGRVVAEATRLDGGFLLLVGRRLELVDAVVLRFLPAAAALLAVFLTLASVLTLSTARQFRRRIAATNAVFDALRRGDLQRRVAPEIAQGGDELAALAGNINEALAENERLVKGLDAFSQTAAHELNRELSHLREEVRADNAPKLVERVDQLIGLLGELLSLAKIEGRSGFENRPLDPAALVAAAAQLYRDTGLPGGVKLVVDAEGAAGARIHGTEEQLRGAVMNLIENALKHSPPEGTVDVVLRADAREVTITVRDRGPGAPSEDLTALITAGSRGAAAGHGFGLRMVQAVAIRHGARVQLRNTHPGFEATMRFSRADVV